MAQEYHHMFISLLLRCTHSHHIKSIHSLLLTTSLLSSPSPSSTFLTNSLIRAYSRSPSPSPSPSLPLLLHLLSSSSANHLSFPFLLPISPFLLSLQLHSLLLKNGLLLSDPFIQTSLLRSYSPSPSLTLHLFDDIPTKDPFHLTVLMTSFLHAADPAAAIRHFNHYALSNLIRPDPHALTTALTACSHAGALRDGTSIHKKFLNKPLLDPFIASALITMYAKCGSIAEAVSVFESVPTRNTFLWSSMIGGYAMHGLADDAMDCLNLMEKEGVRPDAVIALGVLSACAHAGRVKEGMALLTEMEGRYGVKPKLEHYSCAVDMLCRVGRLDDAMGLIGRMPMRPMAAVWGAVLTACRTYGNVGYAEVAVRELQRLMEEEGKEDEGVYVQMSNVYMKAERREDARRVRKMVGSKGVKKTVAYSSVEVDGSVSKFVAGDLVHPMRVEIERVMEVLNEDISNESDLAQEEEAFEDAG